MRSTRSSTSTVSGGLLRRVIGVLEQVEQNQLEDFIYHPCPVFVEEGQVEVGLFHLLLKGKGQVTREKMEAEYSN